MTVYCDQVCENALTVRRKEDFSIFVEIYLQDVPILIMMKENLKYPYLHFLIFNLSVVKSQVQSSAKSFFIYP